MERLRMPLVRLVIGLVAAGCSSSENGGAVTPAPVADAGPTRDANPPSPTETNRITCGAAPHQEIEVQVNQISAEGVPSALEGSARVVYSGGCDALTTNDSGKGYASVSLATSPRSVKILPPAGFIPSIYAEAALTPHAAERVYRVFPDLYKSLPTNEWNDSKGFVLVNVVASGSAACSRLDDVSLSVEGHPELKVKYYRSAGSIDASATATTTLGVASIANAPPGEKLKILASKPQCNASTVDAAGIGLVPIEAGVVSNVSVALTDIGGPSCGPGPYVEMTGQVKKRTIDYLSAPLPGATVTWSNCPGVTATTRSDGSFGVMMTKDAPFSLTIAKAGVIPLRLGELSLSSPADGVLNVRDDAWRTYEPGWNDAAVSLVVAIEPRGTGPCATSDGVSVTVKNHPEAVAHYLDTSVPPVEVANGTATTTRGYVELTGLPAGTYEFDVTTSKACKLSAALNYTGSLHAVAGHINLLSMAMQNP
jgi:hypothetical protein